MVNLMKLFILMVVLMTILLVFIISNIRKKDNKGKRKILKLIKYIALSVVITYFIINIFNIAENYTGFYAMPSDKVVVEENLKEYENSIYYNNTQSYIDELVGYLELIKYFEIHPELKKLDNEIHSDLYEKITTYAYENEVSISEISKKIQNDDVDAVKKLYDNTKYSKEEFLNIIELVRIEYEHCGISFDNQAMDYYKAIINEGNYDIDKDIKKLQDKDFDTIAKYSSKDDFRLIQAKYPYATEIMTNAILEYSDQIINLIYSIVIGIFIGTTIYAYTETNKFWILIAIIIVEIILIGSIEFYILNEAGVLNVEFGDLKFAIGGCYNGPSSATMIIAVVTICMLVIKVISNKLNVKKLNKINNVHK